MKKRILILGIDGGNWHTLRPAIERGFMPTLKALLEEGASGCLESTFPAITPAAWSAFQSGRDVAQTGIFNFASWNRQTHRYQFFDSRKIGTTVWQHLNQAGYRVGLLNVPMTYPPQPLDGFVVTGLLTPSTDASFTHPAELKDQLLRHRPDYETIRSGSADRYTPHDDLDAFLAQMTHALDLRADAAEFLLQNHPVDVCMVHFQAPDLIFHALWHLLDPEHPLYDPTCHQHILENFFRPLDHAIARTRQAFADYISPDHTCFVVSDHGFESHHTAFLLGDWLCQQGFLVPNPRGHANPSPLKRLTKKLRLGKHLKRFLSSETIATTEQKLRLSTEPFLWHRSRAIAMGRGADGYIYLTESDPARRENTADKLVEKLQNVRLPDSQLPIARKVHRKHELFGPNAPDTLPDLILEPQPHVTCTSSVLGESNLFHHVAPHADFHLGKHHPDGILIAAGPYIASRPNLRARLIDMPATLLAAFGFSATDSMTSRPILPLFSQPPSLAPLPDGSLSDAEHPASDASAYSPDEQQQINQRLQDLGYL